MKDISDDYAGMIKEEFGGPVDVLGTSTGGSIVQHFAADHPHLIRKLVIHSSAHTLSESAKAEQLKVAKYARKGKWFAASKAFMSLMLPKGPVRYMLLPFTYLISLLVTLLLGKPDNLSDLVNTIETEDQHNFANRLHEIKVPMLVIAGAKDPFHTEHLFRKTAEVSLKHG